MPCSPPPIMKSSWRKRRDIKGRQFIRESVGGGDTSLRLKESSAQNDAIPPRKHFESEPGSWAVFVMPRTVRVARLRAQSK